MNTDDTGGDHSGRYREIADELRLLLPKMKHPEAAEELRQLVASFERLAEHAEGAAYPPQDIEETLP